MNSCNIFFVGGNKNVLLFLVWIHCPGRDTAWEHGLDIGLALSNCERKFPFRINPSGPYSSFIPLMSGWWYLCLPACSFAKQLENIILCNQLSPIPYCWLRMAGSSFLNENWVMNADLTFLTALGLGYTWSGESKHCPWLLSKHQNTELFTLFSTCRLCQHREKGVLHSLTSGQSRSLSNSSQV